MNPSAKNNSRYDLYTGQQPNIFKRILTNKPKSISETPEFKLTGDDFELGQDSTILVKERTRGSKLEGIYQKKKGLLLEQSNHTLTFLSSGRTKKTIISKRGFGYANSNHAALNGRRCPHNS